MKRPFHLYVFLGTLMISIGLLKESRAQTNCTVCPTSSVVVNTTNTSIEFPSHPNCSILFGGTTLNASKASGLSPGTTYSFNLTCLNCCLAITTYPAVITNLVVNQSTTSSVSLSWVKPAGNVSFYNVSWTDGINPGGTNTSVTFVNATGLTPGVQYTFTVTAVADDTVTAGDNTSISQYTRPNAVTNLVGAGLNTTAILLTWLQQADYKPSYSYVVEVNRSNNQSTATETYTFTGLVPGSTYYFRVFTVVAGVRSSEALTTSQTTPESVTDLQAFGTTSNLTVTWHAPVGLVNLYVVQLYRDNQLEQNRTVLANDTNLALFQTLRPGTVYAVKVLSVSGPLSNQANVSNATFPNPPGPVSVTEQTTSSINITWNNPTDMTPGQYNFTVSYGAQQNQTSQNQFLLQNLQSGTAYNISVATVGELGYQSQVVMTTNYTKPQSVSGLMEAGISPTSVTLVWAHPGPASSYLVVVTNPNGTLVNSTTVYSGTATITGLQSGTNYTFTVTAQTDNNTQSNPVTVFYFTRPYAIRNLTTYAVNTTTIFLNWTCPDQYQSGYTYSVSTTGCVPAANLIVVSEMAYINGLTPGSNCTFNVSVKATNGIQGSAVLASQYTKPEVVQPIISSQTNSSLQVSWGAPPGNVEKYEVSLNDTSVIVNSNVTYHVFPNLLPGRLYGAIVNTVSGPFRIPSNLIISATYPNPPGPINVLVKTTSSLSLGWTEAPLMANVSYNYQVTYISAGSANSYNPVNNSVQLSNLLSGTPYNISVTTVGYLGFQSQAVWAYLVTTRPQSVGPLMSITSEENITLKWSQPADFKPGYQYYVTWTGPFGNSSNTTAALELIIRNLVPGSPYNFTVTTTTADGTQGAPLFTSNCTKAWQVSNLTCETPNDPDAKVILSWDKPKGMSSFFQVTATDTSQTGSENSPVAVNATGFNQTLSNLRHFTNYTVRVQTCSCGLPSNTIILSCITGITVPAITPDAQSLVEVVKTEYNSFTLQINSKLFNSTNGPVTHFCVLVNSASNTPVGSDLTNTYEGWTTDPTITYLATCSETGRSRSASEPVVVGNSAKWNNYTNGALKPLSTYSFAIALFTQLTLTDGIVNVPSSLQTIIGSMKPTTLPQNPIIIGAAVGATLGIFGILFLITIGFIIYWRTLAKKDTSDIQFQSMRAKVNLAVRVEDYEAYYKKQKADSSCGFAEEFEDLKTVGTAQSKNSAMSQENKAKNRYNNVLPYDSSRVKLSIHGSPFDDYINANYIPGYNSKKEFIAAQGPLPGTVNEFWRMIWEKNVQTLVMLTRCNEQGRVKCEEYWPSDTKHFGNITVTTTSEIPLDDWTIRDFDVKNVRTAETRSIRHFHFTAWPDHGVPETTELLINFRHLVREHMEQYSQHSPTIVHCSAGVGRTGTLIAIDRLIFQIERESMVDVYGVIHDLRMHRPLMVQTEDQYVFLNQCAMDIIRARTGTNVDLIYQNSAALTIYENIEPMKASHRNGVYNA